MDASDGNSSGTQFNPDSPPVCSRCNKHIYDGTIFQVQEKFWHNACMQCIICRKSITGCCHMKANELYCRSDFIRLFGAKCSSCKEIIAPSDGVHVANSCLYHTACFTCVTCRRQLHPGDYFYLKDDGKLLCSQDYQQLLSEDRTDTDSESDESGSDDTDKRHRTSFNDNQLRMLTESYQSNKRPPRGVRKRISTKTGLSVRTVQIWFQNRRAKDKNQGTKHVIKNKNQGNKQVMTSNCNNDNMTVAMTQTNNTFWPFDKIRTGTSHQQTDQFQQQTTYYNSETPSHNYQLYCPLDFLVPNEMPPNVDLSSADICNGEVITEKHNTNNFHLPRQTTNFLSEGSLQWLTV